MHEWIDFNSHLQSDIMKKYDSRWKDQRASTGMIDC